MRLGRIKSKVFGKSVEGLLKSGYVMLGLIMFEMNEVRQYCVTKEKKVLRNIFNTMHLNSRSIHFLHKFLIVVILFKLQL